MNSSVYIFGNIENGYTQYPDDYAKEIYQNFYAKATANSQILIHRDNNLMYYGYIRKLDEVSQYIGFCILLNGVMFSQVGKLFSIFENAIAELVLSGEILMLNNRGNIISFLGELNEKQHEVERITTIINNDISELEVDVKILPPVSFGITNNESKIFSVFDKNSDIVESSVKYGYTCIFKENDYDSVALSNNKSIIIELHKEKEKLIRSYNELQKNHEDLNKQKKQYGYVKIAAYMILCCGFGLLFLYSKLNNTQKELTEEKQKTIYKNNVIERANTSIDSIQLCLNNEKQEKRNLDKKLSAICTNIPFVVTDCVVNAEDVTVTYYAIRQESITIHLKAINESNSEIVSNSHEITIYEGKNELNLKFDYPLSSSSYYYVNIIYDDRVIGGRRW